MSKKVIEVMKKRMSLEERKRFVKNCNLENINWYKDLNNESLGTLFFSWLSFNWADTEEGYEYWYKILKRFTTEELSLTINLKEL